MATTYDPIATATLSSTATSITLSSIPSTYTDLRVIFVGAATGGGVARIRFNSDTANNYSNTLLYGDGTSAASNFGTNATYLTSVGDAGPGLTAVPALSTLDIMSYANTSIYKSVLQTGSNDISSSGGVMRWANLYRSTSAISSITYLKSAGTFDVGTTITVYGIKAA